MPASANRLSALDDSFLSVESPTAHMHVGWAAVFDRPAGRSRPRFEDLRAHIGARLFRAPRYRQKLCPAPLELDAPCWVDDSEFDLARHVKRASSDDLDEVVAACMSEQLDRGRPLWEVRLGGWTASFNVLYPPLKGFAAGAYPALPARSDTPVDVVPVDYVADAIFELAQRPAEHGEVNHLVAGERATTVGRLIERAGRYFRRRPPRLLPPRLYRLVIHPLLVAASRGRRRRALRSSEALFPYFTMRVRFDDRRSRARLEPAGIRPPRPESYLDRLLDFAVAAHWGKRRLKRADARR